MTFANAAGRHCRRTIRLASASQAENGNSRTVFAEPGTMASMVMHCSNISTMTILMVAQTVE